VAGNGGDGAVEGSGKQKLTKVTKADDRQQIMAAYWLLVIERRLLPRMYVSRRRRGRGGWSWVWDQAKALRFSSVGEAVVGWKRCSDPKVKILEVADDRDQAR